LIFLEVRNVLLPADKTDKPKLLCIAALTGTKVHERSYWVCNQSYIVFKKSGNRSGKSQQVLSIVILAQTITFFHN